MLRNDLITLLGEKDNDPVVINVNGTLLEVGGVTDGSQCIVLVASGGDQSGAEERST